MKKPLLASLIFLIATAFAYAQVSVVFTGIPLLKISEGGVSRVPEELSQDRAIQFKCTITRMDNKYYWATRENVELVPIPSGAFITYWATNGSGYVRVINPKMKTEVRKIGEAAGDPEAKFDYVEHLLLGLKSVTYYGTAR